ncbi:hypothetical protein CDD81_4360 [Ophiocordyceps australis]|uniref:Probable electron transfer flavoprotein subunit alpha n=1 Tax=Ophiocordyceps australis TaxID=1399860 RepID=A0A2C5XVU4_9HYPO|nr:hypothetical protein CDD81_4360 [Ophiocordyceps australis]
MFSAVTQSLKGSHGLLSRGTVGTFTAAKKLGGTIHGLVAGSNASSAAHEAAKVEGIDKILAIDNKAYEKGLPENFAHLLVANIKKGNYTHVISAHTTFGKNVMPRVSALLDVQQISDVTAINDEKTFVRPIYAGNAITTVESLDAIKILTIRGTAFAPEDMGKGSAVVSPGVDPESQSASEWLSEHLTKSDRPDLATATKVVSGGRGLRSKQDFDAIMFPLADALGAAVGASRAAVDSGYADNSLQVGQTGKVVAPQLYLAIGISGAIQHLAGMKDSKVIAAINKDADAPIFQVADVGLQGDLFKVVPDMVERIKQA